MPRYFFDSRDVETIIDDTGLELPDLLAVRNEVARSLARSAVDFLPGAASAVFSITVRDETRAVVLEARLIFSTDPEL